MNNAVFFQKYPSRYSTLMCWGLFLVLLVLYLLVYMKFLPSSSGMIGHDFSYLFPAWLDGEIWFRNNGLQTPWFTPSFCAGQPFFPDPQSTFYSIPQFLVFIMSPLDTVIITLVMTASLMFWGSYLLMRYVFNCHRNTALLVGSVMMLNGFLPHRIIVGHVTYHAFALVPWIALFLLVPLRSRWHAGLLALAAGAFLSYWVHSGFGTLILAGGLAVALVALVAMMRGAAMSPFLLRSVLAAGFGLALSASKLWAGFAFIGQFPRTFYALPGVDNILDELMMVAGALFLPSQDAYQLGMPVMRNMQWALSPHEWAYNFSTAILAFLAIGGLYLLLKQWRHIREQLKSPRQILLLALLLFGLSVPLLLNYWSPSWNEVLKQIPLINSMSSPLRWLIVFIPLIAVLAGLLNDRMQEQRWGAAISLGLIALSTVQMQQESREYYAAQNYSMVPIMVADQYLKQDLIRPQITNLGTAANIQIPSLNIPLKLNDTMVAGVSQVACYNPIFGYQLEKFSAQGLSIGSVMHQAGGKLNLKNPACYVYPNENGCRPGDQFTVEQREQAQSLVSYQPYAFEMPESQKKANMVTQITLYIAALALLLGLLSLVVKRRRYAE